jgi:hypothetical protein
VDAVMTACGDLVACRGMTCCGLMIRTRAAALVRCCRSRAIPDYGNGPLLSLGVPRWSVTVVPRPAWTAALAPLLSFPPVIRPAGALGIGWSEGRWPYLRDPRAKSLATAGHGDGGGPRPGGGGPWPGGGITKKLTVALGPPGAVTTTL